MGTKNQTPNIFQWQSTSPVIGFLPNPHQSGSIPSGLIAGPMASTNIIYSNILDVSRMDNLGMEVTWTGTPVGVFQVMLSNSGQSFYSVTFSPALAQPAGLADGYGIDLTEWPWKYIMLKYTNTSGTGSLFVYNQQKDLN